MSLFERIRQGLGRTSDALVRSLKGMVGTGRIDESTLEDLVERLVRADVGIETAEDLVERLRRRAWGRQYRDTDELLDWLADCAVELLGPSEAFLPSEGLQVVAIVGVNGAGKTTTIGKLAQRLRSQGRNVLVGACDTFRAAAVDQLEEWCRRAEVPCVRQKPGADPAAVAYDAVASAKVRGCDVVLLDTAGRLQNRADLMAELGKILKVVAKHDPSYPQHVWLVLDGNTGQNAVSQAKLFHETAPLTGLVVTKLDGTAKGGAVLSLRKVVQTPVLFLGLGEKIDDLVPFQPREYARALFERSEG
ncbi:MAG TPA: signal recognition particle-docking protein FtsY [Fibrobacteria bacterium]|nr:signal recognition particle-docking protein FtsY [Fibrobacteria bacterium]HOX50689.1 signal recognition particle-docking protein FtsY [Fibrobacteria bacterium]